MSRLNVKMMSIIASVGIVLAGCGSDDTTKVQEKPAANTVKQEQVLEKYYFTANEGGTISKVNVKDNKVTDTIMADGVVHNIQLSPDGKVVGATLVPHTEGGHRGHGDESPGKVLFYDAYTNELLKEVEVGNHPAHVVYSGDGKYVLVTNNEDDTVSVIDAATYEVVKTIPTGNGPHGFRITADSKFAYIANMGEDTVSAINLETFEEERIKTGNTPVTTGVTKDGKTLMATLFAENALAIVDLETKQVVKVEVGTGPAQVYIGPDGKYAYVANQGTEESPSNSMSIVDLETKAVVDEIKTGNGAHGVTVSSDGKFAYVTNMFENTVSIIDLDSKQVETIDVGEIPNGITVME
ncbi:YncE family protein [Bacillus sp. ISL-37]|jgi:YVTN family beta-propeller protein|uniref:YncE family protein n=1 Tax=Bacillus sp. ISL-37 TaxID=2819123 RepID=UPI001BEB4DFD|nr:YncE family protein [Bacillus sp. ISL-37]MBT2685402.1 YncE family protein [Bacillus sp. ISL-37]